MRLRLFLMLLAFMPCFVMAQIIFDPNQKPKKIRSDEEKIKLGLSFQLTSGNFFTYGLLPSVALYRKNVQFAAGPHFIRKNYTLSENETLKDFGYNISFRYIFPQNRGFGKIFIPVEFDHQISIHEEINYFDHLLPQSTFGNDIPKPDYSFNLLTRSESNQFSIRSGLGIFIILGKHFNVQLQATIGPKIVKRNYTYSNSDSGEIFGSEKEEKIANLNDQTSGLLSLGIGWKF